MKDYIYIYHIHVTVLMLSSFDRIMLCLYFFLVYQNIGHRMSCTVLLGVMVSLEQTGDVYIYSIIYPQK